jgi:hypothetical protein
MSPEEADKLVERLISLSEIKDFETLQKFDFIDIGPTLKPKHHVNASR